MHLDLHVHTALGSPCSEFFLEELAEAILMAGLHTAVITDHWTTAAVPELRALLGDHKCDVIAGIEITTEYGDFLVFDEDEASLDTTQPALTIVPFDEAIERGFIAPDRAVIWAHPCSQNFGQPPADALPDDVLAQVLRHVTAIEGVNGHCQRMMRWQRAPLAEHPGWRALQIARRFGLPVTYGSDAHDRDSFQLVTTLFHDDIRSAGDLIAAIKANRIADRTEFYFGTLD